MHEIGIVRQIIRTVDSFVTARQIKAPVEEVVVDCGELSLVIPKYLEEIYPVVIPETVLEHARLTVSIVPGLAECDDCDEIFNVCETKGYCPNCGSFQKTVLSGRDCKVREIHLQEEPPQN